MQTFHQFDSSNNKLAGMAVDTSAIMGITLRIPTNSRPPSG